VNGNDRDVIVLGNPNGKIEFLDSKSGDLLDELQIGNSKEPFADVATTPVLGQNNLFAASYNTGAVAVDPKTRLRRWELKEKGITQLAEQKGILVAAGAKFVFGVRADSGKIIWKFKFRKGAPGTISIHDGKVFVGSDIDGLYILDLSTGVPLQILGSGLGFAGTVENIDGHILAMSSAGVLFLSTQADLIVSKRSIARK
jgi:outer membrane protein assembly factor BamB